VSAFTSNAIIAKAKSIYGNTLKESDYNELLKKTSINEVASYLKNHINYNLLSDISENLIHRGHLEILIKENWFNIGDRLSKFIYLNDKNYYRINIVKFEIDLISLRIRQLSSKDEEHIYSSMPVYLKKHIKLDLSVLSKCKTVEELIESLKGTPYYKTLLQFKGYNFNAEHGFLKLEHQLDEYYYDFIFKTINNNYRGKVRLNLSNIYQSRIEVSNIIKIYRLKRFYAFDPKSIEDNLIYEHGRISKSKWIELCNVVSPIEVLDYLSKSNLKKFSDNKDYVYIEYFGEKIKYDLSKKYMHFASSAPQVFSALMALGEIEIDNIINIIEGIRYQVPKIDIESMLIY
jgi:V/A-type H+-transporting ATPase subunit C